MKQEAFGWITRLGRIAGAGALALALVTPAGAVVAAVESVATEARPAVRQSALAALAAVPVSSLGPLLLPDALPGSEANLPYLEMPGNWRLPWAQPAAVGNGPQRDGAAHGARPAIVPGKRLIDDPVPGLYAAWDGLNQGDNRTLFSIGVLPPDTNGATSGNVWTTGFYVQTVNSMITVWDYSRTNVYGIWPAVVYGPAPISALFSGMGGACQNTNDGDPIVLYDAGAGRFLVSQFALPNFPSGPFSECVAISQTGDPTGGWYRYEFQFPDLPDYPKIGVWPDGYYLTTNVFRAGTLSYGGAGITILERPQMLVGGAARSIHFDTGSLCATGFTSFCNLGGMLPGDADAFPPPGTPNYVVQVDDDGVGYPADRLQFFRVTTNWASPGAELALAATPPVDAFDSNLCDFERSCIRQPDTAQGLDAISDRLMNRLAFRQFADHRSMVTNHTVDVNGADQAGVRWYELRQDPPYTNPWYVAQQGTYAPDGASRWMGSVALDAVGNIALGYSVSSETVYPGLRYTGHFASDPPGTMRAEMPIVAGLGSQTSTTARWGDYSSMSIAPSGCDFVYTNQYLRGTSAAEWYTRIANFGFDACFVNDTTPPDTFIDTTPPDPSHLREAVFTFHGTDSGSGVKSFECSLDGATFQACVSGGAIKYVSSGTHTLRVRALDNGWNIDQTPASHTWTNSYLTKVFRSSAGQDGWILESAETSSLGGSLNARASTLIVGDNAARRQYRSILSFKTSALPDTAAVLGGEVRLKQSGALVGVPFALGALVVDIDSPFFGTSAALTVTDFEDAAALNSVAAFGAAVGRVYSATLGAAAGPFISRTALTQFRVRFTGDDDNDAQADYVKFFSGENATSTNRPTLNVFYTLP